MRRALALVALLALAGCEKKGAAASGPGEIASVAPEPAISARRPTKRYYLVRIDQRCEIYARDGDAMTTPITTPCPPDLAPDERIRIAGKTCTRESADKSREQPVVCPDPLTNEEKKDLAREGKAQ